MANNIVPKLNGKDEMVVANHPLGSVEFFRSGAYCNLTQIAKLHGKRIDNWLRLKSTKELIAHFESDPVYKYKASIVVVKGNNSDPSDLRDHYAKLGAKGVVGQGTWAHPDIAILFAQWCSPKFALWVAQQIRHLLAHGEVNLHHKEWTADQVTRGLQYNRDDIKDLYGR